MNVQEIEVIDIDNKRNHYLSIKDCGIFCKGTTGFNLNLNRAYITPFRNLKSTENEGILLSFRESSPYNFDIIVGDSDVDYIFKKYLEHPEWFNGSSPQAFRNRESVINLTFNILGDDWYSLFKQATTSNRFVCTRHYVMMLRDIMLMVGITRSPDEKPRHSLPYHMSLLHDVLSDRVRDNKSVVAETVSPSEFSDLFFGEPNKQNTAYFIRQVLLTGGIGLLITLLNAMYGSVVTKEYIRSSL